MKKTVFMAAFVVICLCSSFTVLSGLPCVKCGGEKTILVNVDCRGGCDKGKDKFGKTCPYCDGKGYEEKRVECPACGGDGIQKEKVDFPEPRQRY